MSENAEKASPILRATILETVDNQLRDNKPPEAKKTYKRLRHQGYSDLEARELIASVLLTEIYNVLKYQRTHDEEKYIKDLKRLPELPDA